MNNYILSGLIGLGATVAIEIAMYVMSKSKKDVSTKIVRFFIIWIFSFVLSTLILTQISVIKLITQINLEKQSLINSNLIVSANKNVSNKTDELQSIIYSKGYSDLIKKLEILRDDDCIYINRKQVPIIFEEIFLKADTGSIIYATNCIPSWEQETFSNDKNGVNPQKAAIEKNNITIKRIFIYDNSRENHKNDMFDLKEKNDSANIETYIISKTELNRYNDLINKYLYNSFDFGIINEEILFVTDYNKMNYTINGAYITTNKEKIDIAKELWNKILNNAKD